MLKTTIANKNKRFQQFIQKANVIHKDRYTYENVNYTNSYTPVDITCPLHGNFSLKPDYHIVKKHGCPDCTGRILQPVQVDPLKATQIVEILNKKHNHKYDYSLFTEYTGMCSDISIICKEHGIFKAKLADHMYRKSGCMRCRKVSANIHTIEDIIDMCSKAHQYKYTYPHDLNSSYENNTSKLVITCNTHGNFTASVSNHLHNLSGCPTCSKDCNAGLNYVIKNKNSNQPYKIYIALFNQTEEFIKVGITKKDAKRRLRQCEGFIKPLFEFESTLGTCHSLEHMCRQNFLRYQPPTYFEGWTECFHISQLNQIKSFIETTINQTH